MKITAQTLTLLLLSSFAFTLAKAETRSFTCNVAKSLYSGNPVMTCGFYEGPDNRYLDIFHSGVRIDLNKGDFENVYSVSSSYCYPDPYNGEYCNSTEPADETVKRSGYFRAGFPAFRKLLIEMREGTSGFGEVDMSCTGENPNENCAFIILGFSIEFSNNALHKTR